MCGRGIDQVLAHPCSPEIYEDCERSAEGYVLLAEQANGPISRRNGSSYVWGAALGQLERMQPDARIINLETAVTRSHDRANKGINYRVSPENADCLAAAKINCCVLANNHVLDWGRAGLLETLTTLQKLNVKATGAGRNDHEARAPAVLNLAKARLLIFRSDRHRAASRSSGLRHPTLQASTCCLTCARQARWRPLTKSPQTRTLLDAVGMSQMCHQQRTHAPQQIEPLFGSPRRRWPRASAVRQAQAPSRS